MIRIFKRRRPTPAPEPITADPDILTAFYWGLNLIQWHALTDFERAACRRTVTVAPNFGRAA
jgi:hypothetical protein